MSMTQLQRDALALAKQGDWSLADAMELRERGANFGVRLGGRMRVLAFALSLKVDEPGLRGEEWCDVCGGSCNVVPEDLRAPELCLACKGEGVQEMSLDDVVIQFGHLLRFEDLNGDPVDGESIVRGGLLTRTAAYTTLRAYETKTGAFAPLSDEPPPEVRACA